MLYIFGIRRWSLLFACLLFSSLAVADEESHKAAALSLLETMQMDELLLQSIEAMLQLEIQNNPSLAPFAGTMRKFYSTYMSGDSLREEFARMYSEAFTEQELNEINAFYLTPTGQKAISETPTLMSKGAQIGQQRVLANISELQFMIQEEANRISELQSEADDGY